MAISFVDSASSLGDGSTFSMPSHEAGDLLIRFDYSSGNTPSSVAGWQSWPGGATHSGNSRAARLTYKIAASSGESAGRSIWSESVTISSYRGAEGPGAIAWTTSPPSGTIAYPALARSVTDGTSWGGRCAGSGSSFLTANNPSTPPNTPRSGVNAGSRGLDSNGPLASNPTAGTQPISGSAPSIAVTFEIIAAPTGWPVKVHLGGSWVQKPMKRWDGSAWVEVNPKIWNGTEWV